MAKPTRSDISTDRSVIKTIWKLTTTDNTGTPVPIIGFPISTFQANGTFGGATVVMEGSLDGTNFVGLKDITGAAIAFTAAGLDKVVGACQYLRARLSVVGTAASISCILLSTQSLNTRTT